MKASYGRKHFHGHRIGQLGNDGGDGRGRQQGQHAGGDVQQTSLAGPTGRLCQKQPAFSRRIGYDSLKLLSQVFEPVR